MNNNQDLCNYSNQFQFYSTTSTSPLIYFNIDASASYIYYCSIEYFDDLTKEKLYIKGFKAYIDGKEPL
jgi:hypothetical protein